MEAILRESEEAYKCGHCADTGKIHVKVDGEVTCPECGYDNRGRITDGYSGYHQRTHPDSNGWQMFEVYHRNGGWYWSACDNFGQHKGAESIKFPSSCKAYYDGVNNP